MSMAGRSWSWDVGLEGAPPNKSEAFQDTEDAKEAAIGVSEGGQPGV